MSTDIRRVDHLLTDMDKIESVEGKMLSIPQVECSVAHHFGPGIYIREVSIPADTFSIGHYQNVEHLNHMVKGRVIMLNDDGTTTELVAPIIFTSKPGRKVGYIVEDMVWLNIYPTNETDIDKLEETFLTKSDTWKSDNTDKMNIQYLEHHADREDFKRMLDDVGYSSIDVDLQSSNKADLMNVSNIKIKVSDSPIEGKGLFSLSVFSKDEIICPARISGKRTQAGRYTNHSSHPNAVMKISGFGDIDLVALREIKGCQGGGQGEEITIDYRQAVSLTKQIGDVCQP